MPIGEGFDLPPAALPWSDFHWFKVSPRRALVVVVLSDQVLWYSGHFLDGRMWPCPGQDCEMCAEGIGGQVRYVLACAEVSSHRAGLLEVGRGIGLQIRNWIERHETLRGMQLEFSKHSLSRQSRTEVLYIDGEVAPWWRELEVPDMKRALMLTWRKANMPLPPGMG